MEATVERTANRCLPLLIANESGWVLHNPFAFTATWDGRDHPDGISIEHVGEGRAPISGFVRSGFGHGIVTFAVPYLFRTPPGYNLLARGPANWPKDGACALEGVVETDWSVATFTMNWKLTRPGHSVTFEEDEPFCMVVPQRRGELEAFEPELQWLSDDPATEEGTREWAERRHRLEVEKFLSEYSSEFEESRDAWERDYFKGRMPDGSAAPEHQTKLRLRAFAEREPRS